MVLVRSRLLGFVWLAGLLGTHASSLEALIEHVDRRSDVDSTFVANFAVTSVFLSVAAFLAAARIPWLVRERPEVSATWTATLWTSITVGAFALGFVWYDDVSAHDHLSWAAGTSAVICLGLAALLPRLYPELPARARGAAAAVLGVTWLLVATGGTFPRGELEVVGAIAQVVVLGVAAYAVLALGRLRTFNLLTGLIALRVLVMYFEVFGSMLDTGLGMITGGALTLLLAWLWKRKSPARAARRAAHGGAHPA
jgi:hypothetical protein